MKTKIISIIAVVASGTIGYFIAKKRYFKKIDYAGQLVVVKSKSEKSTNLYLSLDKPIEDICKANIVNMQVSIKEFS